MKKLYILLLICFCWNVQIFAVDKDLIRTILLRDSFEQAFKYEKGPIILPCGNAQLFVPVGFKFLNASQAQATMPAIWNCSPPADFQGAMFADNGGPFDSRNERFTISHIKTGHVYDEQAMHLDTIFHPDNQGDTLWSGYQIEPTYDANLHVLYYARNYFIKNDTFEKVVFTFFYFGRNSIIELNTQNLMYDYAQIVEDIPALLNAVVFNDEQTYGDFSDTDPIASFGLNGLIPGSKSTQVDEKGFIGKYGLYLLGLGLLILFAYFVTKFLRKR